MIKKVLFYGLVLFAPVFFLPLIQLNLPVIPANKFYFLAFVVLLILCLQAFDWLTKKKVILTINPDLTPIKSTSIGINLIDLNVLFLVLAIGLSVVFASTNKAQALFVEPFGFGVILFLALFYLLLRSEAADRFRFWSKAGVFMVLGLAAIVLVGFWFDREDTFSYSSSLKIAHTLAQNPKTAIVGAGLDNFAVVDNTRSFLVQILIETGILGFLAFVLFLGSLAVSVLKNKKPFRWILFIGVVCLSLAFVFLPVSPALLFILFLSAGLIAAGRRKEKFTLPAVLQKILAAAILMTSIAGFYFVGRLYLSDYYFSQALSYLRHDRGKLAYEGMKQAVVLNPYNEAFRRDFSRMNLAIADQLAAKEEKYTDKQKLITGAIETAINEAKAAVALNPQKAANWENLGFIYKNLIGPIARADLWAAGAYERAIAADPVNPSLYLELGGVYYKIGRFDEAEKLFTQAISVKPDWSNAYYNRAGARSAQKNPAGAVSDLETSLKLIPKDSPEFAKVAGELAALQESLK